MKINLLATLVLFTGNIFVSNLFAQSSKCATMKLYEKRKVMDPQTESRMNKLEAFTNDWIKNQNTKNNTKHKGAAVITIPVVVHVVYHTTTENISTSQIISQIDALNEDFRLLNSDSLQPSHPFWTYTADCEIQFCLATKDPQGNASSGITRTYTDSLAFSANGSEKFTASGGKNNWDPTKYLNLWVCNLGNSGGTLGYAAFPSDLNTYPAEDGVVIRYEAFGTTGTAGTGGFSANALGRTATHEVGHWLNLRHIWGDGTCASDFVSDTEIAEDANYNCPSFPHNANSTCGSGSNGEMYMNYMDYVDDNCMKMFTFGQSTRMKAALNGARSAILTSNACVLVGLAENAFLNNFSIYPNPAADMFVLKSDKSLENDVHVSLIDQIGRIVYSTTTNFQSELNINLSDISSGSYLIKFESGINSGVKKVIVIK
ncbi:MAG: T9SS type A sorting domain-containing protein [Sphingobacteriaceae bacterium]|nr:T9SS type A sorting domain-containing protein [Sphingobacteriaceae bacterium]